MSNTQAPPPIAPVAPAARTGAPTVGDTNPGVVHSLSLRVQRLAREPFHVSSPVSTQNGDMPGQLKFSPTSYNSNVVVDPADPKSPHHIVISDDGIIDDEQDVLSNSDNNAGKPVLGRPVPGIDALGISEYMAFPASSSGEMHLGETMCCYISSTNDGDHRVTNIVFKAEIQSGLRRYPLVDNSKSPLAEMTPGKSFDHVIRHKLSETGGHMLVCSLSYTTHNNENLHLRKFFKFPVTSPLSIETAAGMFIESFKFIGDNNFRVTPLQKNPIPISTEVPLSDDDLSDIQFVRPNDQRQYLFQILYADPKDPNLIVPHLGYLEVHWRSWMGGHGTYTTDKVPHVTKATKQPIILTVSKIPERLRVRHAFSIELTVINNGDRIIQPRVSALRSKTSSVLVRGVSGKMLKDIDPRSKGTVELSCLAIDSGLQALPGIRVYDAYSEKSVDFTNLATVMVERDASSSGMS